MKLRNMTSLYLRYKNELLLLYRQGSRVVNNLYIGSAGGHFEPEELNNPTGCVLRELEEELGLDSSQINNLQWRYLSIYFTGGELRQNYYYFADLPDKTLITESKEGTLHWMDIKDLEKLPMPRTSELVIRHYTNEGQYSNNMYGVLVTDTNATFQPLS